MEHCHIASLLCGRPARHHHAGEDRSRNPYDRKCSCFHVPPFLATVHCTSAHVQRSRIFGRQARSLTVAVLARNRARQQADETAHPVEGLVLPRGVGSGI